jgi:hypothetical protein
MCSPRSGSKPKVPEALKDEVTHKATALLERVLKPARIVPPPPDMQFNYVVDLYVKWHGSYFYFGSTWRCPAPNCISEFFDAKFTRLEYAGGHRFNLAYMRYTNQWVTVFYGLALDECLEEIEKNELFWP